MRNIDLTNARNVELWSGRRLYVKAPEQGKRVCCK